MVPDQFDHRNFDDDYPGICFLGDAKKQSVSSDGGEFYMEDIGIKFSIPPDAVPKGKTLDLVVRPCLSGPFILPEEYELASPVYLISPTFDFEKEVKLSIAHFSDLQSMEDCENMVFISAAPVYEESISGYKFRALKKGEFSKKNQEGSLSLCHFCLTGITSRKRKRSEKSPGPEKSEGNTATKKQKGNC